MRENDGTHLFCHINNSLYIRRCFVRDTDKKIEAEVENITFQRFLKDVIELFARNRFVNYFLELFSGDLWRNGNCALFTICKGIKQRRTDGFSAE